MRHLHWSKHGPTLPTTRRRSTMDGSSSPESPREPINWSLMDTSISHRSRFQVDQNDVDLGDTIVNHGAEVSGSVLLDQFGIPARGVIVSAASESGFFVTETDFNGKYSLRGLPRWNVRTCNAIRLPIRQSLCRHSAFQVPELFVTSISPLKSRASSAVPYWGLGMFRSRAPVSLRPSRELADSRTSPTQAGTLPSIVSHRVNTTLVVTADGFADQVTSGVLLPRGGNVGGITSRLAAGGNLSGLVTSTEDGSAIPYALIALFDGNNVIGAEQARLER